MQHSFAVNIPNQDCGKQSHTSATIYRYSHRKKKVIRSFPAGKTGTTDNYTNAAFIGYTPKLVVGVEIFFQGKKERSLGKTGGQLAAPLCARIMKDIAGPDGTSGKFAFLAPPFPDETGLDVEKRKCDGNTVWFIKGTVPENACKDSDNPLELIIQVPEKIGEKIKEGIEKFIKP